MISYITEYDEIIKILIALGLAGVTTSYVSDSDNFPKNLLSITSVMQKYSSHQVDTTRVQSIPDTPFDIESINDKTIMPTHS